MSVLRFVLLACDGHYGSGLQCDEESPSEVNLATARRTAKRLGWHVGRTLDHPDYCAAHAPDIGKSTEASDVCWCCDGPYVARGDADPWEGRLDGYCEDCALARCDAYPGEHSNRRTDNGRSEGVGS